MVSDVLLTGYTDFLTDELLASAFPNCRILIAGETQIQSSIPNRISVHKGLLTQKTCQKAFRTYEFDEVVYFSRALAPFQSIDGNELENLALVLEACSLDTRIVYFAGPQHPRTDVRSVLEASALELCHRSSYRTGGVNVVISPWVYALDATQPTLQALFDPGTHELELPADQEISFVASEDLSLLLFRLFENWEVSAEPYEIPNVFTCTVEFFTALVRRDARAVDLAFRYSSDTPYELPPIRNNLLRTRYMWFPVYSFAEDLPTIAQYYHALRRKKWTDFFQRLKSDSIIIRIAEQLIAFFLMQLVLRLSHISIQFEMIDFRLLYIVIMGTMYNMRMGLGAAALGSLSLILAYAQDGTSWVTLFYEPTNWLPFIAYFTVGALCGYIRSKDLNLLKFAEDENASTAERYAYLEQINEDILQEKKEYKQQIIGSRDSFGKIFDISQQLNHSHPKQLTSRALEVIETVMDNNHVAIYNCMGQRTYGRLVVSSSNLRLPYSMPMTALYEKIDSVGAGEAWVNRELDESLPCYLYGIHQNGKIEVVILIQTVEYNQLSLYYENLFRVICGLISSSLLNAMSYQEALHRAKCVEGSENILMDSYFLEELGIALHAQEQKQATHLLLHVERADCSISDLEERIFRCIRASDVVGFCKDEVYIILLQARESDLAIVNKRFDAAGLRYQMLGLAEQTALLQEKAS